MPLKPSVDRYLLALQPVLVDARAATGEARSSPAEQSGGDRRSRRGVADAHLAEHDEVGIGRERIVTGGDRIEELSLVHGGSFGEVCRRGV